MPEYLSIVETAYRASIEEQDDPVLWLNAMIAGDGLDLALLFRSNAVNYLVKGQKPNKIKVGSLVQKHPPEIEADIGRLIDDGVPVYAIAEDLAQRGIAKSETISGVTFISSNDVPSLLNQHKQIWHW
ncbi:MAG: DsrE family protein [Proteobacteria bacterium]|nr:DsrE family protein [Pseudomonadota bacterium]